MKSQFKKADASGARFALIFGPDELAKGQVSVKPLRGPRPGEDAGETPTQLSQPLADVAAWAQSLRPTIPR
jgi:histidyl-tRNA synthetase